MSAPIFISYSSKDRDIAETICQALEARGHACWIACRNVDPGQNFQEAIVRALRSAKVMLLIFSANANNSDEIKKELVLAGRHRVAVVPVRVEDVVPSDAFAYELATRQWIDLFNDWEKEIERLALRIGQVLRGGKEGGGREGAAGVVRRPLHFGPQASRGIRVAAALLATVLVIGTAFFYLRPSARAPSAALQPPPQTAAATPPAATPSPPSPAAAPAPLSTPPLQTATALSPPQPSAAPRPQTPSPESPSAATLSPDEAAWQAATAANTLAAFEDYLKASPADAYVEAAQLRIVELILASPTNSKAYDGKWLTRLTCPASGRAQAYSMEFSGEVRDGAYRGRNGTAGEPGSLVVEGRIIAEGTAAFLFKGIVGSTATSGGAAVGTPFLFHALAQFERGSGTGKRVEFRPCNLTFAKE